MASMPGIIIKIGANTQDAIDGINKVDNALGRASSGGEKFKTLAAGLGLLTVAAGAFAVKLGVDAVQAAAADEAELAKLNTTLNNLGFGAASGQVSTFIDNLQFASGVSESQLRPAFDRLVRSTKDVAVAQQALQIALDASAITGKDVESIANAMGRGFDGATGALGKLGIGLDSATLKTGDMNLIMSQMATTFAGGAANAANTLDGKLRILKIGMDEVQESFGQGLIDGFFDAITGGTGSITDASNALRDMQDNVNSIGETIGVVAAGIINGFIFVKQAVGSVVVQMFDFAEGMQRVEINVKDFLGEMSDAEAQAARDALDLSYAERHAAAAADVFGISANNAAGGAANAGAAAQGAVPGLLNFASAADQARQAANLAQSARATQASGDRYTQLALKKYGTYIDRTGGTLDKWRKAQIAMNRVVGGGGGGGGGGGSASSALQKVNPLLQKQIDLTQSHIDQLTGSGGLVDALNDAVKAERDYASSIAGSLLGNINLSNAFDPKDVTGSLDKFVKQIGDTTAFSTELARLGTSLGNTPGAMMLLDQIQQLGVDNGRAIISGLTTEVASNLASQLDSAITAISGNAWLLADHFYGEGVTAALQLVDAMAAQIEADEKKLREIGKKIGQPIGEEIKAAIAAALATASTSYLEGVSPTVTAGGATVQPPTIINNISVPITANQQKIATDLAAIITKSARRVGTSR